MKNGPEVNAMVYETNAMQERNSVINQVMRGEALYAVSTLRMAVYLRHDPDPYPVMLDNGAEINVIHFLMATKLGLVVTQLNHGLMMSTNQSKSKFLGIVEDTPVLVDSFWYQVLFFMMEDQVSYDCILEQPFKV